MIKRQLLIGDVKSFYMSRCVYEKVLSDFYNQVRQNRESRLKQTQDLSFTEFEVVMMSILELLLPDRKCRIVLDYDPGKKDIYAQWNIIQECTDE